MSGYIHGGSALTLDIGARNGTHTGGAGITAPTSFVPGDWVAISAGQNSDGGYEAVRITIDTATNDQVAAQTVMPVGVVLGPPGMSYRPGSAAAANDGGEFLIRVKGVATAKVTAGGALTAPIALSRTTNQLHVVEQAARNFIGAEVDERAWAVLGCGVMLDNHGGTGVEQRSVWVMNNRL